MAFGFTRLDAHGHIARLDALTEQSIALLIILRLIAQRISQPRHAPRRVVIAGRDSPRTFDQFETGAQTLALGAVRVAFVGLCEQRRIGRGIDHGRFRRRLG